MPEKNEVNSDIEDDDEMLEVSEIKNYNNKVVISRIIKSMEYSKRAGTAMRLTQSFKVSHLQKRDPST